MRQGNQAAKPVQRESTRALQARKSATTAAPDATPQRVVCQLVPLAQEGSTKSAAHKQVAKIVPLGNIKVKMASLTANLVVQ